MPTSRKKSIKSTTYRSYWLNFGVLTLQSVIHKVGYVIHSPHEFLRLTRVVSSVHIFKLKYKTKQLI